MWDDLLLFVAVGLAAQLVDGAIGMAYGVISSSVLLSMGLPPAVTSAAVHTAETFTTGASGLAHWHLRNIDRSLLWRLALPGMVGGAIGAYALTAIPGDAIRPWVSGYLLLLGIYILLRAGLARPPSAPRPSGVAPLGFFGGFLDSMGGGGWGPIVTSTLLGQGTKPRYAIGTVSLAEFFVTATISATFLLTIDMTIGPIVAGLVLGGVLAAPLAAYATRHLPERLVMMLVGTVVVLLSVRGLLRVFA